MRPVRFRAGVRCAAAWLVAGGAALLPVAAHGQNGASACIGAIRQAEAAARIPAGLLTAIGLVESGRPGPDGRIAPWPWSINVAGVGAWFESKEAAVAAVQVAWRAGVRSIDVGCMQVNLLHHPDAFASLDEAFDPARNAGYAAGFLQRLFGQTRSWGDAAAAYHSQTPGLGDAYRQKVAAWWPGAGGIGAGGVGAAPVRAAAVPVTDPHDIYTPEFRARLAAAAADRARLAAAAGPGRGDVSRRLATAPSARRAQFAQASFSGVSR